VSAALPALPSLAPAPLLPPVAAGLVALSCLLLALLLAPVPPGYSNTMASEKKQVGIGSPEQLAAENDRLRTELAQVRAQMLSAEQSAMAGRDLGATLCQTCPSSSATFGSIDQMKKETGNSDGAVEPDLSGHLSIVVLGASGDLAVKKTYPALYALYRHGLLPKEFAIIGYARSKIEDAEFKKKISAKFPTDVPANKKEEFLRHCWYHSGQYDSQDDFHKLHEGVFAHECKTLGVDPKDASKLRNANRIFYLAIPPGAFVPSAKSIKAAAMSQHGWNRVIVEKPFGRDSQSSAELGRELAKLFHEDQMYRIDHYLGKEMVQNLMVLRFANKVFEPLWNRDHINCVIFSFKENFGTQGRGGYFNDYGIIRDVMQNHLLQMLSILAMETPLSLSAEDVRDEKVRLLRSISAITTADTVIGQYTADPNGKEPGYTEDKDVPDDSVTPTFATCVMHINNPRWAGIPFIMKAGKALDEKKADIRIQFKRPVNTLFSDISPNELVLRVGPDEAVYLKMTTKQPGLEGGARHAELDLSYKKRFSDEMKDMPEAYERLILDVIRGDHNLFVRADELAAAWKIFTPLLHDIEQGKKLKPIKYEFGSRGPKESDDMIARYGYVRTTKYSWEAPEADDKKEDGAKAKL